MKKREYEINFLLIIINNFVQKLNYFLVDYYIMEFVCNK